ncbi:MAG TPA: DUF362 domain-containing protein [Chloroflexota bacterium]|nr:DUF362 domain-containing protein [Chloroflexota bacterium]
MAKSRVWYADAGATNWTESLVCKAKDLFYESKIDQCIEKGDKVAIKIHVGEWNRTSTLRPEFVAAIVEEVKACGGRPFVTETTTLTYHAFNNRHNGTQELEGAYRHGFTPEGLGCPIIIGDGWSGCDDVRVEIPEGNILKETYIGAAIAAADVLIPVVHAKGHSITSYGGAIKLIGIGAQSKRGKYQTHLAMWGDPADQIGYPAVNTEKCLKKECAFWKQCEDGCPTGAVHITNKGAEVDFAKCYLCYSCQVTCLFTGHESIGFVGDYFPYAQIAMSDAALGCLKLFDPGKVAFISYAMDISPECDCFPWAGTPVAVDVGVLASKDIVAIDAATVDLIDRAPIYPGSRAAELGLQPGDDKFKAVNAFTPRIAIKAAERIGMGSTDYELVEYEPVLNAENAAKWQIQRYPTTMDLRKMLAQHDLVKEVQPFKRVPFKDHPNWHAFEPAAPAGAR